jgi:hypothetical protein
MGHMTDGTLIRVKFLVVFVFLGCGCHGSGSRSVNLTTAQKLSDSFMSDWVAHRTDAAFDEMEPEFTGTVNRAEFAVQLEKLSQYCGWPLDSELKHVENGTKVYLDGHTNSTRKFTYAATTTQYPKGQCYFSIEVAPSGKSAKVTTFGPLRVTSGNPFP